MTDAGAPPNAAEIKDRVDEALHELQLTPDETSKILSFANEAIPYLFTPEQAYLVLGSYRAPYRRRLRIVENELNKRIGTYAFSLSIE